MIQKTFNLFIQLKRFKAVARELNADGHRTVNEALFTGQSVARILRDQKHLEDEVISQDLWDQAQVILKANKRSGNAKRSVAHLCSGLLKCGCGQAMYVPSNSKKYVCSKCRNKIAKDDLETIVLENLKQHSSSHIRQVISNWSSLEFTQKREIIETTISSIIAEDKKVIVSLFVFT